MNSHAIASMNPRIWDRKIVNTFWLITSVYILGQFLFLMFRLHDFPLSTLYGYVIRRMIIPNTIMLGILLLTELYFKFIKKFYESLVIFSAMLIAYTILIAVGPRVSGVQTVLVLPILVSAFYFNKKFIVATCITNICVQVLLYIFSPYQRQFLSIYGLVLISFMLVGTVIVCIGILERGEALMKSIEQHVKAEERLIVEKSTIDMLSKMDALTGLYNHGIFHEFIETVIEECDINDFPMQLALIDIDDFKKINDTFGHWIGDIILREVAQIIRRHATPDDFVARYGGEEFAFILTGKSMGEAFSIIEDIRKSIATTTFMHLKGRPVTVSIGLHNHTKGEGKEPLFKAADQSLYAAKTSGKNVTICSTAS